MKKFRFPLRSLAVLHAHHELRARELFATSTRLLVQAGENRVRVQERVAAVESMLNASRRGRYSAAEATNSLESYRRERVAEHEAERIEAGARTEMQRLRTAYIEAHRKLKVVERLEEKARELHRVAANREEQAELDDFAGRRIAFAPSSNP